MIDIIKSIRRAVAAIVFNAYETTEDASLLPRLATVFDNRQAQEDPVNLEWIGEFFEMREWIDEKTTQSIFSGTFAIPIKAYESTVWFDRKKLRRPQSLGSLIPLGERLGAAFSRGKIKLVADTFRLNPLAYDGQNLFDTDHTHPDTKGSYSNVVSLGFANAAAPTTDEVKTFLHACHERLVVNRAIQAEIVDADQVAKDLVVIVHNGAHFTAFNKVRTMQTIDQKSNELVGSFSLFQDVKPAAGQANYIEVILGAAGAPRPVIFVVDEEPGELKVDASGEFKNRKVAMGLEAYYGTKPGWPQVCLQGRP